MKNYRILITLALLIGSCGFFIGVVGWTTKAVVPPVDEKSVAEAVTKGFTLLQTTGAVFINKAHCASCHHTTMTSMIAAVMGKKGIADIDTTAVLREMAETGTLNFVADPNLNNQFVPAKFLTPYVLLGLAAQQHSPDFSTDIAVNYIISQALPDGHFSAEYARVPFEYGDIHLTALSVRAIALYAPQLQSMKVKSLLSRCKTWIEQQHTTDQQELAFQLLGMSWCGSDQNNKTALAHQLIAMQHKDGGWSQLPTMSSDAYATGQALFALLESGTADVTSETVQKAIGYLISTQDKTGAWLVNSRSNPIQPFVNSDFPPYDDNQFISAAATSWAALALVTSLPDKKVITH